MHSIVIIISRYTLYTTHCNNISIVVFSFDVHSDLTVTFIAFQELYTEALFENIHTGLAEFTRFMLSSLFLNL
jgi:hypothetical protein